MNLRYARLDEDGSRVVCACGEVLALLNIMVDGWGVRYRTLLLPHDGWIERDGVWREKHNAHAHRERGKPAKPRRNPGRGPGIARWKVVWAYPTQVRCPRRSCGHKRLLDADVLGVVGYADAVQSAEAHPFPLDDGGQDWAFVGLAQNCEEYWNDWSHVPYA